MGIQTVTPLDVASIRADFPILSRMVGGPVDTPGPSPEAKTPLVYLDNAATSQTPQSVIDAMSRYYETYNANVHRGIHQLSMEASLAYEAAHDAVASFIGAAGREEVIFTKNTTESMNLVAQGWGLRALGPDDSVVVTAMEHHASLVPWQQVCKRTGAELRYIPVTDTGAVDMEAARTLIDASTAMVSVVHISNTLGTIAPVAELAALAHAHDAYCFVDGAQSVPTRPVDVDRLGADFLAFSGHKMLGPTGIGVLWGREAVLEEMEPYLYGGEMIRRVTYEDSTWEDLPWKFEAGTPPIAEAIGLHAAIEYLEGLGMERIRAHEDALTAYAYEQLTDSSDIDIYGPSGQERGGLVAFNLEGVHAHDLSSILDDAGVAIRAGDHCTQPLHDHLEIPASARASFYIYNTTAEVDALVDAVDAARELFA
jgi:cysteine desulfurase/selenocysteine lyase